MFRIGCWNGLKVLSKTIPSVEDMLHNPGDYVLVLQQTSPARIVTNIVQCEITIVYSQLLRQDLNIFHKMLGEWNSVQIIGHIDDVHMLDDAHVGMQLILLHTSKEEYLGDVNLWYL